MPRKSEENPREAVGYLVACPTCGVHVGERCVVQTVVTMGPRPICNDVCRLDDGRRCANCGATYSKPKLASAMHKPRIAWGKKWQHWHKGLEKRLSTAGVDLGIDGPPIPSHDVVRP